MRFGEIGKVQTKIIFLLFLTWLLVIPLKIQATTYPITWNPQSICKNIPPGASKYLSVTFVSTKKIRNVNLRIVPQLQPFLKMEPDHFDIVPANIPQTVMLHFEIPLHQGTGISFEGTIQVKYNSDTLPQPFKIKLNIGDIAETVGPTGKIIEVTDPNNELYGVKVNIPAGSLLGNRTIFINEKDIAVALPQDTTTGGVVIDLEPDGIVFNNNIVITLPYEDKDNDGFVDYTGITEDDVRVITWDSNSQAWVPVPIIGQDTQNNTVTFATNHFSYYTTSVPCIYSDKVSIFTIDGLNFVRTLFPLHFDYPPRVAYLQQGILDMDIPGIHKCDIYPYGGLTAGNSWNGDATETKDLIKDLNNKLVILDLAAKNTGRKFIVVSHSWGTQLATFAMSYSGLGLIPHQIQPDLFITLSSPAGSNFVDPSRYTNTYFYWNWDYTGGFTYLTVPQAQSIVESFISERKQEVIETWGSFSSDVIPQKWINYWDVGDLISGPLDKNNTNPFLEDKTVRNDAERDLDNMKEVHAITSLSEKNWKDYGVVEEGENFSKIVKSEIQTIIQSYTPQVSLTIDDPGTSAVENLKEFEIILGPGESLPKNINLNWSVTNQADAQATSCTLTCESGDCSDISGTKSYPSVTSQTSASVTSAVMTYKIYCSGPGGDGPVDTVTVTTVCKSKVCQGSESSPTCGTNTIVTDTYVCEQLCTRDDQCLSCEGCWIEINP